MKHVRVARGTVLHTRRVTREYRHAVASLFKELHVVFDELTTREIGIPKPSGETRTLYVQNACDRVADTAVNMFLRPIVDADSPDSLYGYREGRGALQALKAFGSKLCNSSQDCVLLRLDVSGCFNSLKRPALEKSLKRRFNDERLFQFVGDLLRQSGGVPQGSPLSPTLADCHLQPLAWELDAHGNAVMSGDDIVAICRNYNDAALLRQRLNHIASQLGVSFAREKGGMTPAVEGTSFLGYHLAKKDGQLVVTASPKALEKLNERLVILASGYHGKAQGLIDQFNDVLRGWGEYFCFDYGALAASFRVAFAVAIRWLDKRFPWRIIRRYYLACGSVRDGDAVLLDPVGLFRNFPVAIASGRWAPAGLVHGTATRLRSGVVLGDAVKGSPLNCENPGGTFLYTECALGESRKPSGAAT